MNANLGRRFYIEGNNRDLRSIDDVKYETKLKMYNVYNSDVFQTINEPNRFPGLATHNFTLKTTYPGFITGSGYAHPAIHEVDKEQSGVESEFQLGFYFDHTTGAPVIPGSSVKGVLKSVFPKKGFNHQTEKNEYIRHLLNISALTQQFLDENWIEIFFGAKQVFLDAYISKLGKDDKLFEEDYITPHTSGIFKNPIPIRFLKIAPGVQFTFQFKLKDWEKEGIKITAEQKKNLFKQILLDFGIGAKRNVGYGALEEVK